MILSYSKYDEVLSDRQLCPVIEWQACRQTCWWMRLPKGWNCWRLNSKFIWSRSVRTSLTLADVNGSKSCIVNALVLWSNVFVSFSPYVRYWESNQFFWAKLFLGHLRSDATNGFLTARTETAFELCWCQTSSRPGSRTFFSLQKRLPTDVCIAWNY